MADRGQEIAKYLRHWTSSSAIYFAVVRTSVHSVAPIYAIVAPIYADLESWDVKKK